MLGAQPSRCPVHLRINARELPNHGSAQPGRHIGPDRLRQADESGIAGSRRTPRRRRRPRSPPSRTDAPTRIPSQSAPTTSRRTAHRNMTGPGAGLRRDSLALPCLHAGRSGTGRQPSRASGALVFGARESNRERRERTHLASRAAVATTALLSTPPERKCPERHVGHKTFLRAGGKQRRKLRHRLGLLTRGALESAPPSSAAARSYHHV